MHLQATFLLLVFGAIVTSRTQNHWEGDDHPRSDSEELLVPITHVCRHWRELARSSSSLGAYILVKPDLVDLAGPVPILLDILLEERSRWDMVDFVVQSLHCTQELTLVANFILRSKTVCWHFTC